MGDFAWEVLIENIGLWKSGLLFELLNNFKLFFTPFDYIFAGILESDNFFFRPAGYV